MLALSVLIAICLAAVSCAIVLPILIDAIRKFVESTYVRARLREISAGGMAKSFENSFGDGYLQTDLSLGMQSGSQASSQLNAPLSLQVGLPIDAQTKTSNKAFSLQLFYRALLEGGVPFLSKLASWLLHFGFIKRRAIKASNYLSRKGVKCSPQTACEFCIAFLMVAFVLSAILFGSLSGGVICSLLLVLFFDMRISSYEYKHKQTMEESIPDALRSLGSYYSSGLTLFQSLEQAAIDIPDPLGSLLGKAAIEMRAGKSASEALEELRKTSGTSSLKFLSVALEVQQKTGGPLDPLLQRAALSVEDALEMKRFLRVHSAQARLSAKVVSMMPIGMLAVLVLIDPSYLQAYFGSAVGTFMFVVALAMEALGIVFIRKILDIRLEV